MPAPKLKEPFLGSRSKSAVLKALSILAALGDGVVWWAVPLLLLAARNSHPNLQNLKRYALLLALANMTPMVAACQECEGTPFIDKRNIHTLAGAAVLTYATINARRGLFSATTHRLPDLAAAMVKHAIHVLLVSETNAIQEQETFDTNKHWEEETAAIKQVREQYNVSTITSSTRNTIRHTAIMLLPDLAQHLAQDSKPTIGYLGRWLTIKLHLPSEHTLTLAAIYGDANTITKQATQAKLITDISDTMQDLQPHRDHMIIGGDFNEVLYTVDASNPDREKDAHGVLAWLEEQTPMLDLFRTQHDGEAYPGHTINYERVNKYPPA